MKDLPIINVYSGLEGMKSNLEEGLQSKTTIQWVGGGGIVFENLGYSKKFIEEKLSKANIKIVQPKTKGINKKLIIFKKKNVRILPSNYSSRVAFITYGDKTIIGLVDDGDITIIKIESKEFTKGFNNYFNIIWNVAEPVYEKRKNPLH